MAKGTILKWLHRGWDTFLDPEKRKRVDDSRNAKEKTAFSLHAHAKKLQCDPDDLRLARLAVYRKYAERALEDAVLVDSERNSLAWAAKALDLSEPERAEIDSDVGRTAFGHALAAAVAAVTIAAQPEYSVSHNQLALALPRF